MSRKVDFETRLARLSLIAPGVLLLLLLWVMFYAGISLWLQLLVFLTGVVLTIYMRDRIFKGLVYQFRSLNNLLDALIQGDYTLRARPDQRCGELGTLIESINGLAVRLSRQRWESVESQLLVRTIIDHIDVAIVALSEDNKVRFLNPAAKKLLLLDQVESGTGLLEQLAFMKDVSGQYHQVLELSLGGQQGRFNVHVESFREGGLQQKLLFITDVSTLLRSEERKAWQSLVRVISHEINNSLSPISSISQTLRNTLPQTLDAQARRDLVDGLKIISERAGGLIRFVDSYRQLAKLPEPKKEKISISQLVEKLGTLFAEQTIALKPGEDVQLYIDPVQMEQVLINLYKNAAESMAQSNPSGEIQIAWHASEHLFKMTICDQGAGLSNPDNLFVPFYSTKKHGSGIGLVLCRRIIESHDGRLTLANRADRSGCCATIELPLQ